MCPSERFACLADKCYSSLAKLARAVQLVGFVQTLPVICSVRQVRRSAARPSPLTAKESRAGRRRPPVSHMLGKLLAVRTVDRHNPFRFAQFEGGGRAISPQGAHEEDPRIQESPLPARHTVGVNPIGHGARGSPKSRALTKSLCVSARIHIEALRYRRY